MKTIHSTFNNSNIYQTKGAGYFGAVIENNKFHRSGISFSQVISVSMRNCEYEVSDRYSDNVKISGNYHFNNEPVSDLEGKRKTFKQLICLSSQITGQPFLLRTPCSQEP